MSITISARHVGASLATMISVLLLLHLIGQVARFGFGYTEVRGFVPLFYMGGEVNVPAFYSSAVIFTCAVVLSIIGVARKTLGAPGHVHWFGLSIIFAYLSMDEALQFHERLLRPMHDLLGSSGIFHLGWTVPYGLFVIFFTIVYRKFLWNLPARTRKLFIVAGLIYVGGALGLAVLESYHVEQHGWDNITAVAMITIEDTMEMSGIALFLYSLLSYIGDHIDGTNLRIVR